MPRFAGDEILQKSQQVHDRIMSESQKAAYILERQRKRDVAAAMGEIVPFTQDDIYTPSMYV